MIHQRFTFSRFTSLKNCSWIGSWIACRINIGSSTLNPTNGALYCCLPSGWGWWLGGLLWCHSLRACYICIVAVQHCHSSNWFYQSWWQSRNQFLQAPMYYCNTIHQSFGEQWGGTSESIATTLTQPPEKHSECHGFCWCAFQLEIGASDDTMDGCL
jgi:hypothetical protein